MLQGKWAITSSPTGENTRVTAAVVTVSGSSTLRDWRKIVQNRNDKLSILPLLGLAPRLLPHTGNLESTPMTKTTESYAQSLRVIGQALETLRINVFALEKREEKYIVRDWEPSFLESIAEGPSGLDDADAISENSNDLLVYSPSDAERLETSGRLRRGSNGHQDTFKLSSGLRLVGDYLDKKRAVAFDLWWSNEAVRIKYEPLAGGFEERNFTVQNLRDLGIGMYLRRSRHQLAK